MPTMLNTRESLIATRNELMEKIVADRTEVKKHGIGNLSHDTRTELLNKIWNIDEQIMDMT